jgi:hypothetical protein
MTTPDDDLRSMMHGAAESIDAGDLTLDDVRATANRRGLRRRVGAVVGVLGLVGAGVVVFVATGDSDDPATLVSADPTIAETPESTVALDDTDDTIDTVLPEATAASVTVEVIQRPGAVGQPAGVGGAPQYGEWVVPWRDGFLVGAHASTPQPLPDELPEEIVALFPPEVVELFDGELPPTISEATAMLSEAGLLDVVTDILAANPEASDAIYSVPVVVTGPALDVRFTTDGVTWEPVEMTMPPGADYLPGVTTVGDRLTVAYTPFDSTTGRQNAEGVVRVASTADLSNWDVQEVVTPPPPVTFPTGIGWSADVAGFAATESGWALSVHASVSVDPEALLPADVRAEYVGDYGMYNDETGIVIERSVQGAEETIRYTWEELGVGPDVAVHLGDQRHEPNLWASTWGGTPTSSGVDTGYGQLVATSSGFLRIGEGVRFSLDGLTWTTLELPVDDAFVSGSLVFDGGVVLLVSDAGAGAQFYRVDEAGGSPTLIEVPGLPANIQSGYSAASREAIVIDASEPPPPPPPFVVEHDGHRLTVDNEDLSVEVVDLLTGEVVAEADVRDFGVVTDGPIVMDEAGLTVTDPETAELVVVFTNDVLEAASEEQLPANEYQYEPDLWLLASRDGDRFLLVDLDDGTGPGYPMVGALASNGSNVLAQVDEEWVLYDLP